MTHWQPWQAVRDRELEEGRRLKALTANQGVYLRAMEEARAVVCTGPAGTGKSYMACGVAARLLGDGKVKKVVFSRPLLECDEEVGTLPGDLWEKVGDMLAPLTDALGEFVGADEVRRMRSDGRLVAAPLAKLRGSTLKGAFCVLDEAQNATYRQLRMFLTRLGKDSRMVVCGDHTQSDLPYAGSNSLLEVVTKLEPDCHRGVRVVRLTRADVVRDELVEWFESRLAPAQGGEGRVVVAPPSPFFDVQCPACKTTNSVEDEMDAFRCHHCGFASELWLEDELCVRPAGKGRGEAPYGLRQRP